MILFVLPVVSATDWVFNSEYLELSLDIHGKLSLVPKSPSYTIEYVIVNLSFIPKDGFQEEVLDIQTEPPGEIKEGSVIFKWDKPDEKELKFNVNSNIKSFNKIVEVKDKIGFPLKDLPNEVEAYTKPSETIDSYDEEIIRKASEIIGGEDDLYSVVFKLGDWTKKNVRYDLSTLTDGASQKASWVLRNKEGVCDELTNLFIAMNRALGIPAKFISGVAYTNAKEFEEGFGPHGWAEVYFPEYGWVPFDVTYGEFGFVDASHIKLKESLDSNDASTKFQWVARNVDIKTDPLDIKAERKDTKGRASELISVEARAVKENIGFGSYNLIEATVKNLNDYYVASGLRLSKSKEIEIIGEEEKNILLGPNEERKVNWIIKVSDNLEQGYMYTFPFVVSSLRSVNSSLRFDAIEDGKKFSLEGIESLVKEYEEEKNYLGDVELRCKADNEEIYEYESTVVKCDVKNTGNVYLDKINICIEEDCRELSLGIAQEGEVSFNFKPKEVGAQEIVVKANSKEISKSAFVDITVYDKPSLDISDLVYPEEVMYKDIYEISFVLNKKSRFAPYNISIAVEPGGNEWKLNRLDEDREFVLKMYGSELRAGENNFKIFVRYEDKNRNSDETSKDFNIRLVNVSILHRIAIFFRGITGIFK